jgi:hypothetical protein
MEIIYVVCSGCGRDFYISPEILQPAEGYCECPFCHHEFRPEPEASGKTADTNAGGLGGL